ncbi:MAG: hypothetical protein KME37_07705 [Candidatus Thiodiazotropha sp. (ex Codakia orbicularis)]|nr:hypothetical protein [Candidatus Thiodiazotropha sp. (ex Codakia orbicularis)]
MSRYQITGVKAENLQYAYAHIKGVIETVRDKGPGCPSFEKVYRSLKDKTMQLMLVLEGTEIKATAITEFEPDGENRILRVVTLQGDGMNHWLDDFVAAIERYAKSESCSHIEIIGRKGWQKVFKQNGFQTEAVIIRRLVQ